MAELFIVAGCSSNCGKTSVAAGLIRELSARGSVGACKITVTHGDRGCPHNGKGCNVCSGLGGDFQVIEKPEIINQPNTDTARFISSGAAKVVWIICRATYIATAWDRAFEKMKHFDFVVVESNTLALQSNQSRTVMTLDATVSRKRWKDSALSLIINSRVVLINDRGSPEQRADLQRLVEQTRDSDEPGPIFGDVRESSEAILKVIP